MAKIEYKFDPFRETGLKVPKGVSRREILTEIKDYVHESVLSDVGDQTSPVSGHGKFQKLTKRYKEKKSKVAAPIPNLELTGKMLNAFKTSVENNSIKVEIKPGLQADKADNHNKFSAKSQKTPVPMRRFIPKKADEETFRGKIMNGIKRIIRSYEE